MNICCWKRLAGDLNATDCVLRYTCRDAPRQYINYGMHGKKRTSLPMSSYKDTSTKADACIVFSSLHNGA